MSVEISIVMPCYNAGAHLPRSVASVQRQSFDDWELLVINDGSTDGSVQWLRAQADPRIRLHDQTNQGVSAARNAGIGLAAGRYIAFLDADDEWAPSLLLALRDALRQRPDAVLAYCGWQNVGLPGPRSAPYIPPDYEACGKEEKLFSACPWPIHAALTKRDAILAAGGFDRRLRNAEDYALWLEVAMHSPIVRVAEVLAFYHFHEGVQASGNLARAALQFLDVQLAYLDRHPEFRRLLAGRARDLTYGTLSRRGFDCYWKRELVAARTIFRRVMRAGYGAPKAWLYMLPSLLPLTAHRHLLGMLADDRQHAA